MLKRFKDRLRLRYVATAMQRVLEGKTQNYPFVLDGSVEQGLFCTPKVEVHFHGAAWNRYGLVAVVYEPDRDRGEDSELSLDPSIRNPERVLPPIPEGLRKRAEMLFNHEMIHRLATGGVLMTEEGVSPAPSSWSRRGLQALRCYTFEDPVESCLSFPFAMFTPEMAAVAIAFETATRGHKKHDVTPAEQEVLLPSAWATGPWLAETVTMEKVRLAVRQLAHVGVCWRTAEAHARSLGIT